MEKVNITKDELNAVRNGRKTMFRCAVDTQHLVDGQMLRVIKFSNGLLCRVENIVTTSNSVYIENVKEIHAPYGVGSTVSLCNMEDTTDNVSVRLLSVTISKLQDITLEDIFAEGITATVPESLTGNNKPDEWDTFTEIQKEDYMHKVARFMFMGATEYSIRLFEAYRTAWHARLSDEEMEYCAWSKDPWTWVYTFEVLND